LFECVSNPARLGLDSVVCVSYVAAVVAISKLVSDLSAFKLFSKLIPSFIFLHTPVSSSVK
jgi:hypothetical protein